MIFTLIYVSDSNISAFGDIAKTELLSVEKRSHQNNSLCDVHGFLLYYQGRFLQILQGEFDGVISIFGKIKQDTRHRNVRVIWFSNTDEASFDKWKMLYSMEYAAENYKKFTVQPSILSQFVPKEGHLTPEAYGLLMSVATQARDDLGVTNHS